MLGSKLAKNTLYNFLSKSSRVQQARLAHNPTESIRTTTLPSGIQVVTLAPHRENASIGIYIDAGSRTETHKVLGAAHRLRHLAAQPNSKKSALRTQRELEVMGATLDVEARRDFISYSSVFFNKDMKSVVELLSGFMFPRFDEWIVNEIEKICIEEAETHHADPFNRFMDTLLAEAYKNTTLGNSPLPNRRQRRHHVTPEDIEEFVEHRFTAGNTHICAVGVDHDELVRVVSDSLADLRGSKAPPHPAKYSGGEARIAEGRDTTEVGIVFETPEGGYGPSAPSLLVLSALLGWGGSRKRQVDEATSRLSGNTFSKSKNVHQARSLVQQYRDSGLFGAMLIGESGSTEEMSNVLMGELKGLTNISEDEFKGARARAARRESERIQDIKGVRDFLGEQTFGTYGLLTPSMFIKSINDVTLAEVKKVAEKMIQTGPTVTAMGDVAKLPRFI